MIPREFQGDRDNVGRWFGDGAVGEGSGGVRTFKNLPWLAEETMRGGGTGGGAPRL